MGSVTLNRSRRCTPGGTSSSTSSVEITQLLASTPASTAKSGMPILRRSRSPLVLQAGPDLPTPQEDRPW
ncbi:MAG TPA: hypothetical protein VHG93_12670 [Longimicrobium sp.]|nr:hypothetical protein [Longimicrobium sp.]